MGFTPAVSRTDTPLFQVLENVADEFFGATVIPTVAGGFTDSALFSGSRHHQLRLFAVCFCTQRI
jgi:hypothetical protein